jgi:nicotinate-nucleotide pyrophosphorylase (carboxylating)
VRRDQLSNQQVKAIRAVARFSYIRCFSLACAARIFFCLFELSSAGRSWSYRDMTMTSVPTLTTGAFDRRVRVSRLSFFARRETVNPGDLFRQASAQQISMKPDHYDPIAAALKEDIGEGDITTDFFVPETLHATGRITAREKAIVAGIGAAAEVFRRVDPSIDIQLLRREGDEVVAGDIIIEVRGLARSILKAERVALNFLQRLCGIATLTRQFVDAVGNHPAKILDTRKTTPGLRTLEKAAVVAGGGVNHRFGLHDMVLVKDNHLATFGGLSSFADRIRQLRQERPNICIEVEADDLEQARAFAEVDGIDVILLDNMTPAQIREAVALRKDKVEFEASGGITLKSVKRIAATGVDYISIGGLTNAARAIDIGLEMTQVPG